MSRHPVSLSRIREATEGLLPLDINCTVLHAPTGDVLSFRPLTDAEYQTIAEFERYFVVRGDPVWKLAWGNCRKQRAKAESPAPLRRRKCTD